MPEAVARLACQQARTKSQAVGAKLRQLNPNALVTVARGSSDHAATYLSYAIQSVLRIPVASIGPSIHSVYGHALKMRGLAALVISQSGGSGDIVKMSQSLAENDGCMIALSNTAESPLASVVHEVVDMAAGPERAVAATKSFLNSIVAGLWLVADWSEDRMLAEALQTLPEAMRETCNSTWDEVEAALADTERAVIVARGPGLGLAHEFALKLLETCAIHASSYSGAEVLHGPSAVFGQGYPVIALTTGADTGMSQVLDQLPRQGADVITLPPQTRTKHPLVDPLLDIQPIYRVAERLSLKRGLDPDNPPHLRKVTKTI
ncbi:MAG: SIS domain-containing protein [Pseudomonadota bacterium]